MYKVLEENCKLRLDKKWVNTTVILTRVSGGLQVHWVDEEGNILKEQAYSRSPYSRKKGDGFDANDKPSISDPDFYTALRDLGLGQEDVEEVESNGDQR